MGVIEFGLKYGQRYVEGSEEKRVDWLGWSITAVSVTIP
jgi:hypothetical protein